MIIDRYGEWAALLTAILWTATALTFESACKRVGSMVVNFYKLFIAFALLSIFTYFSRGMAFPFDATKSAWIWLLLSGIIGFVIGDICLFKSYEIIGSRISMLIMAFVPIITTITSWILLGETLSVISYIGITITVLGISVAILDKNGESKSFQFSHSLKGVALAFIGAVGQATGLVLSKYGMVDYDPFAATQIRTLGGIACFLIFLISSMYRKRVFNALRNTKAVKRICIGSIFGPFLGVSLSLLAVQHTKAGVAATIMAIIPVLIIPPSILIHKEKISIKEIIGAIIAVFGTVILFLNPDVG